jgi:hypothetical protein
VDRPANALADAPLVVDEGRAVANAGEAIDSGRAGAPPVPVLSRGFGEARRAEQSMSCAAQWVVCLQRRREPTPSSGTAVTARRVRGRLPSSQP